MRQIVSGSKGQSDLITCVTHYNPKLEVQLPTDASPHGLGAVIPHITSDGEEPPITYSSPSLTPAETNY